MASSAREFAEKIVIEFMLEDFSDEDVTRLSRSLAARDVQLQNEARALAIREAAALVRKELSDELSTELSQDILALLSTSHAEALTAHDKQVWQLALTTIQVFEEQLDCCFPYPNMKATPEDCGNVKRPCMKHRLRARINAELRAEPPSKVGEGHP